MRMKKVRVPEQMLVSVHNSVVHVSPPPPRIFYRLPRLHFRFFFFSLFFLFSFPSSNAPIFSLARANFIVNEDFEPKTRQELADGSLAGWAHHVQALLPQGRAKWVNPDPPKETEDDEDDEPKEERVEPEVGPPLLHPIQNDDRLWLVLYCISTKGGC
jgi:hypothetical protein